MSGKYGKNNSKLALLHRSVLRLYLWKATVIIWDCLTNCSLVIKPWKKCHTHALPRALRENSNILTNQVLMVFVFQRNRDQIWTWKVKNWAVEGWCKIYIFHVMKGGHYNFPKLCFHGENSLQSDTMICILWAVFCDVCPKKACIILHFLAGFLHFPHIPYWTILTCLAKTHAEDVYDNVYIYTFQ